MGSTLGNLAGVRIDAAGQVYGQYKGTALVQMAYQSAGSKTCLLYTSDAADE